MKNTIIILGLIIMTLSSCSDSDSKATTSATTSDSVPEAKTHNHVAPTDPVQTSATIANQDTTRHSSNIQVVDTVPKKARQPLPADGKEDNAGSAQGTAVLEINVVPEAMKFDTKLVTVKAGQKVIITITNPDSQQHNLVIGKIGSLNKIGQAANALATDPKGLEKAYVPAIPEVLEYTPLLNPDESYTLEFTAPKKKGDYPYACTFPGHWMIMNGILRVI